ncbi:MAG: hypothetical protein MZV70_50070 [Desulfobacterales bacterium]|nr:hypothetical protein [Desulfobacterales bacterium]
MAKDRSIVLNGCLYEAPVALIGCQVELLYQPDEKARVEVRYQSQLLRLCSPRRCACQQPRQTQPRPSNRNRPRQRKNRLPRRGAVGKGPKAMKATYRSFFGLQKEPFGSDLPIEDILLTRELSEVTQRFEYTLRIGGVGVLTGEIGSGKSTALRYACSQAAPGRVRQPLPDRHHRLDPGDLPADPNRAGDRKIKRLQGDP